MFTKEQRSSFHYWFAHWCAFQMTALNLGIWKPRFLFHDWEKPWWMKILRDYKKVQHRHRYGTNHHLEWLTDHDEDGFDVDAALVDNECSHFTKEASPYTAVEHIEAKMKEHNSALWNLHREMWNTRWTRNDADVHEYLVTMAKLRTLQKMLDRAKQLGLS